MSLILPGLIASLLIYAYIKKADVYSAFISGALEALPMLYKTLPSMCAMMAALSLLRKSGAMEAFTGAVSPALQKAGMPGELVPLFLPEAPPLPFFETFSIPVGRIPLWV